MRVRDQSAGQHWASSPAQAARAVPPPRLGSRLARPQARSDTFRGLAPRPLADQPLLSHASDADRGRCRRRGDKLQRHHGRVEVQQSRSDNSAQLVLILGEPSLIGRFAG